MDAWTILDRVFGWGGVLAYHGVGEGAVHSPVMHVTPERLHEQLDFLSRRCSVIPLRELVARWQSRRSTRDCLAVTFDDAYEGVARWAAPVLRDLDLPATIFVASAHARCGGAYWWDVAERDRLASAPGAWRDMPAAIGLGALDATDARSMTAVRQRVLAEHAGRWPAPLPAPATGSPWRSLSFAELRDLARHEHVDFGVHTSTHPALPLLSRDEQVREIRECHRVLATELPRVQPILAYPYGLYDRVTIAAAREAGMIAAVTMEGRAPGAHPPLFTIPRVGAGQLHAPRSLHRRLSRALRPALVLRNGGPHPVVPRRAAGARSASPAEATSHA